VLPGPGARRGLLRGMAGTPRRAQGAVADRAASPSSRPGGAGRRPRGRTRWQAASGTMATGPRQGGSMRTTLTEAGRDLLRRVPLFAACTDKELATVAALVDDIEVEPGEVVVEEGVPGRDSFIVVAGRAEVSLRGKVIARLEPGDFFGEMSLLTHRLRTATVTPITPMRLLVVELRNFMGLLEVGGVAKVMLRTVVERLRLAQDLSSTG